MGETSDAASDSDPEPDPQSDDDVPSPGGCSRRFLPFIIIALLLGLPGAAMAMPIDPPARPRLSFGADEEGGAPYFYQDRLTGQRMGFEADLMTRLGQELGVEMSFEQGQWDYLLNILDRGKVDLVMNGYELTGSRVRDHLATRPYYVFQLQLMSRADGSVRTWADLDLPRPGGGPWKVGVLGLSAADTYAQRFQNANLRIMNYEGATSAMIALRNGQIDATLQDLPAARYYLKQPEFRDQLVTAGPPEGCGYYVIYTRKNDVALRDKLDTALGRLIDSGEVRAICEKYDIWNDAQTPLIAKGRSEVAAVAERRPRFDLALVRRFLPDLLLASLITIVLACTSMPLAMAIGLVVALGRLYGAKPVAWLLGVYVEVIRGTPLIIQLYTLYFLLPDLGITLSPWVAGVMGLAINYSAYEAEIYRAGLQAIPRGQMEAAMALGMSRSLALRRVIVPQAVRIVIPPVTSDFIALFKDTSVCSVITLIELTKQYSILFNSQGGVVEFGLATAVLYMAMSLPLSWFSRWVERKMDAEPAKTKAKGVIR